MQFSASSDSHVPQQGPLGLAEVDVSTRALIHSVQDDFAACELESEQSILMPELSFSCRDIHLELSKCDCGFALQEQASF